MSFFDRFRKKKEKPAQEMAERKPVPEEMPAVIITAEEIITEEITSEEAAEEIIAEEPVMPEERIEDGGSLSMSVSMSKGSVLEETVQTDALQKPLEEAGESLSNEQITKDTLLLETYQVLSDPIRGGMGSVWKVHHNGWDVDLAMKRPQPKFFEQGSEKRKETFVRECESWINLGLHPNIVSCYYVREIGGVPTIFSEWMENGSLKNRIDDGTLYETDTEAPEDPRILQARLLDIAIQFARGLHYAHESGDHLIHQDVKPDNLLLTANWEAKVADFGLARARTQLQNAAAGTLESPDPESELSAGATHLAPTGGYTPAYCSLEQRLGQPLSRRTDIYSWAVSVLEMYLGKRPWKSGVEAGKDCEHWFEECRVPMPGSVKNLLKKCLAEKPEERPHDFAEVEDSLKTTFKEVLEMDYPREESEAAADTADSLNNRALSYYDLGKITEAKEFWSEALQKTPNHLASVYNQGLDLWREGLITYEELVRRCSSAGTEQDETGMTGHWEEALEREHRDVSARSIVLGETNSWGASFVRGEKIPRSSNLDSFAVISPDGKWIYGTASMGIGCWDAQTLEERYFVKEVKEPAHDFVSDFAVTPDGKYLAGQSGFRTFWVADAADGKILRYLYRDSTPSDKPKKSEPEELSGKALSAQIAATPLGMTSFCLCPDSRQAVVIWEDKTLRIHDLETGEKRRQYSIRHPELRGWEKQLCMSPDGKTLYIGTSFGVLGVLDLQTGQFLKILNEYKGKGISSLRLSKDGESLYCAWTQGKLIRFSTSDMTYEEISLSYPFVGALWESEDGSRMLTVDNRQIIRLWDLYTGKMIRTFRGYQKRFKSLEALEDLSLIVGGTDNGTLEVWDATAEIRRADFEVNRAKSYMIQISVQNETERVENAIEEALLQEDVPEAKKLLEEAEKEYDAFRFLPMRRKLLKFCRQGKLTDTSQAWRFETEKPQEIAADPKGGLLAVVSEKRRDVYVQIHEESGKMQRSFLLPDAYGTAAVCYSSSGRFLAAGDHSVVLACADREEPVMIPVEGKQSLTQMAFSPDEKLLYILTGTILTAFDTQDGKEQFKADLKGNDDGYERFRLPPLGFLVLPCGDLVTFDHDGDLNVFCFRNGVKWTRRIEAVREDENGNNHVHKAALSPAMDRIYVSSWRGVGVWDTNTWEKVDHLTPEEINPAGVYFEKMVVSPDGAFLATGTDIVRLFSLTERKMVWEAAKIRLSSFAFSPDSSALYVSDGKTTVHIFVLRRELICSDVQE